MLKIIWKIVKSNWKIIIVVILAALLFFAHNRIEALEIEKSRLERNQDALLDTLSNVKFRDSLNRASIKVLEFNLEELKQYRAEDAKLIKDLKIRLKDARAVVKTEIVTKIEYRDKLIYIGDSIRKIEFKDRWTDLDITLRPDDQYDLKLQTTDSLTQVFYKVWKHKFWFIRWGNGGIRQEIINHNPNSSIKYSEVIQLKKK